MKINFIVDNIVTFYIHVDIPYLFLIVMELKFIF